MRRTYLAWAVLPNKDQKFETKRYCQARKYVLHLFRLYLCPPQRLQGSFGRGGVL